METVNIKGTPCHTCGHLPATGTKAPHFNLVDKDMRPIGDRDFAGRRIVLNIFPSLDTDVCAASVRRFNHEAAMLDNVTVICVSMDLPFAQRRFCTANGIDNVAVASAFRSPEFGREYGVCLTDGPLAGLLTRAVIILDADRVVRYVDLVDEITSEPDYTAALNALK